MGREWADLALTLPGAGPRRTLGTPGAAHWEPGPHSLLAGAELATVRHLLAPAKALLPRRRETVTIKGDGTRGGTWSGGAGAATTTLETHITQNTHAYTQGESPSRGHRNWPQAEFPTMPASQLHGVGSLPPSR